MKLLFQYFLIAGFALLFTSCEQPPIVFTGPQPEGVFADRYIQPIYRGKFLCESDSAVVVVKGNVIYKAKPFQIHFTQSELEEMEGIELKDGQLYVPEWNRTLPTKIEKDTIYSSNFILRDTLIHLGKDQVLKSFRGHLVINRKLEDEKWEVMLLSLDEYMNLVLSKPAIPEDMEQLKQITPVEDISTEDQIQFRLAPTVIEFDVLLKTELLFIECDYFHRIHQPIEI